jgi:DNA-binding response OmpR family regulator
MPKSVLVVEDDFDTLFPLAELLRLREYTVATASNAEQAMREVQAQPPDLIITDIALPGSSGLQFIQTVRQDPTVQSTPIIVISGCGPDILVEAESAGADICLEKPIRIPEFWHAIELILGEAIARTTSSEASQDASAQRLTEIDSLVEELQCGSEKSERKAVLKRLKELILDRSTRSDSV